MSLVTSLSENLINVQIYDHNTNLLVDTGSDLNCISVSLLSKLVPDYKSKLQPSRNKQAEGFAGKLVKILGNITLPTKISDHTFKTTYSVFDQLSHNLILGHPFLKHHGGVYDADTSTLTLKRPELSVTCTLRKLPVGVIRSSKTVSVPPYHEVFLPVHVSKIHSNTYTYMQPRLPRSQSQLSAFCCYLWE